PDHSHIDNNNNNHELLLLPTTCEEPSSAVSIDAPHPVSDITDIVEPVVDAEIPPNDKEEAVEEVKDEVEVEAPLSTNDASEDANAATAPADPQPPLASSESCPSEPAAETVLPEPASEAIVQQSDDASVAEDAVPTTDNDDSQQLALPPPPRRPPIFHRHLDRRSSRILEGISRKVQQVRQTTSMVLRRSVGSRLSIRPATPHDVFQGSVVGLAGLRGCGLNDAESEPPESKSQSPPQYSVSDAEPATSIKPDDCTSNANSTSADDSSHVADPANELDEKLVEVAAARSTTAVNTGDDHTLNATSDKLGNPNSISRKLSSVRHGTNAAVRNSVTRVKNIFAAKRPVAA
ncbi:hypothetical protein IWW38_006087, partial [Coemansia aciculifera]